MKTVWEVMGKRIPKEYRKLRNRHEDASVTRSASEEMLRAFVFEWTKVKSVWVFLYSPTSASPLREAFDPGMDAAKVCTIWHHGGALVLVDKITGGIGFIFRIENGSVVVYTPAGDGTFRPLPGTRFEDWHEEHLATISPNILDAVRSEFWE